MITSEKKSHATTCVTFNSLRAGNGCVAAINGRGGGGDGGGGGGDLWGGDGGRNNGKNRSNYVRTIFQDILFLHTFNVISMCSALRGNVSYHVHAP